MFILGPGHLAPKPVYPPAWSGHIAGAGCRLRVSPTALKESAPINRRFARVQRLPAKTSLSNQLIFTSRVRARRRFPSKRIPPAVAVDACHGVLRAHRKQGRLFTVLNTGEGKTTVYLPAWPSRTHAAFRFCFFSLSCHLSPHKRLQPCLNLPEPCPAPGLQRTAICMPSAVMRLGLCNKEAESRLWGFSELRGTDGPRRGKRYNPISWSISQPSGHPKHNYKTF